MRFLSRGVVAIATVVVLAGCSFATEASRSGLGSVQPSIPASTSPITVASAEEVTPSPTVRDSVLPVVPLASAVTVGEIDTAVASVWATDATAQTQGEISGPAIAVEVSVSNHSNESLDTSAILVTLEGADNSPALELSGAPARHLDQKLAPGQSASGVYLFGIPVENRTTIRVKIALPGQHPVAAFSGEGPR